MTRVSLKEAYDNKDVVAQIYAIRDTAESAEDSAEQAVTTANTASDHVDALVPQVEGAVENANSASASAQASAQTVAGYENRLATVEDATEDLAGDLNAVTLRVQTAEGQIVTIQGRVTAVETKNNQQDSAISALQTADAQNVKINSINDYALGLTGNQKASGIKGFETYTMKINPLFKRDVPTENYRYFTLEALSADIGVPGPLQSYFASGGGSQATIAQKNAGWDIYGKSSDEKDWVGRFTISLDPDNQRILLTLRLQNLTDGTTKSLTVATLSMV